MDTAARVADEFQERFGHRPTGIARAPGRVNLLGEHVDYSEGLVMPAAIDRATYVAFGRGDGGQCDLWAADFQEQTSFSMKELEAKRASNGSEMPHWALYPAGVAWALQSAALEVPALKAVYASDVPRGAGLSSSASVELAFAVAWQAAGGWKRPAAELARLCQRAENEYVGVRCGIMDQMASACGEAGRALVLDCRSLQYETVPLPVGAAIVIADSGVRHELGSSAYNDRRAACETAVELLRHDLPHIRTLRDVSVADLGRFGDRLPVEIRKRARHVVEEIDRTRQAVPMLKAGRVEEFGRLMNDSHQSLRDLYEVSCREVDVLASTAQSLPGCYGARLTGAGFGGCTVNLVNASTVQGFVDALRKRYQAESGRRAEIHVCEAAEGARLL